MESWHWLWEFEDEAERSGDLQRQRLTHIYLSAHALSNDLPAEKLALFEQGRELAQQLQEPWWVLFYEHWVIETLLYGMQQPQAALDRVVRAVLEARKPIYDAFPQRVDLYLNLAGAYLGIDPIGYEAKLREALSYIEGECGDSVDKRAYFSQLQGYFLEIVGDEKAVDVAWEYLARAEESQSEHFQWDALFLLSSTLYRFERDMARLQLGEISRLGEEIARREKRNRGVAAFLMWRALAARWDGDESEAATLYQRAWELQKRTPPPRNDVQFAAMAFHEAGGELEKALTVCQQSLPLLRRHNLTFLEAQRRLEKCRLLTRLGRSWEKEARRLRRVGDKLPSKAHWEKQISLLSQTAL